MIEKTVVIMRGWPGSGKSTLVERLMSRLCSGHIGTEAHDLYGVFIASADHFFIDHDGIYRWKRELMKEAHQQCMAKFLQALGGRTLIFVDNTNIKQKDYNEYVERGIKAGFKVYQAIPETLWMDDLDECYKRNLHGVPRETIERMMGDFEQDDRLPILKLA
jgi:tRNA uridine 5-carbamoylmethylation protein Kti12